MRNNNEYLERASYQWSEDSIRLIMTPSSTARSLYFYIQEAGYFKTKNPYFTERANLDSFLIVYTLSGKGQLRYGEKEYILRTGQCFYIQDNLRKIINVQMGKDITTEILTSNYIINILSELLILTATNEAPSRFIPDFIKSILKYIDQNFHTKITLDNLEKTFGVSKFHISKEFKKYTGTTIGEYITMSRLTNAKELLKYSDLSVSEITYKVGFNQVSHFINLFKNREHTTPLNFRKEWRI